MPIKQKKTATNQSTIDFYPFSIHHKNDLETDSCQIHIIARQNKTNKKIIIKTDFIPYFYIRLKGTDETKLIKYLNETNISPKQGQITYKITKTQKITKNLLGNEEKFLKITTNFPEAIYEYKKLLSNKDIETFEDDIPAHRRFLIDNKIEPLKLTTATVTKLVSASKDESQIPVYKGADIAQDKEQNKTLENPKIIAIDIETYSKSREIDMQANPILMIALYSEYLEKSTNKTKIYQKVLTYKEPKANKPIYTTICKDEKDMIIKFQEELNKQDPEFITTYYGDGFDLPYIEKRAKHHNITLELGPKQSNIKHSGTNVKKATIKGLPHLDILKFIRYIYGVYWKIDSYSLDNVAQKLLKEKKLEVDLSKLSKDWDNTKDLEKYIKYNLHDAKITHQLTTKVWNSITEFCTLIGIIPDDLIRMRFSRLVENFLLKQAQKNNIILPRKPSQEQISARMQRHIQGAFVFEPTPNIYEDVVVFDFLSLYPTIIISHNIGLETIQLIKTKDIKSLSKQETKVPERNYKINQKKSSFIAQELGKIVTKRVTLKQEKAKMQNLNSALGKSNFPSTKSENKQETLSSRLDALKVLANSFYGYLAFYGARYYSYEAADSVTAFARHYIKDVINRAQEQGFQVIYSDTDSIMITLKAEQNKQAKDKDHQKAVSKKEQKKQPKAKTNTKINNKDKTQAQAHKFVEEINKTLPGFMELEFEGFFPRGIFVGAKAASSQGAKKKYALIDKNKELKIIGFETVRRNWSTIAKEIQKSFLRFVLEDNIDEGIIYLKNKIKKIKEHKIPIEKMIMKMQLKQPLDKYKAIGPHVAVAKRMQQEGHNIKKGMLIEYVIQEGSGIIRQRAKRISKLTAPYDSKYYLKNQVIPSVESILRVINIDPNSLTNETKQEGLSGFF